MSAEGSGVFRPVDLKDGPLLVVLPSAPAARSGAGLAIDAKMLDGWRHYAETWPGPTRYIIREAPAGTYARETPANALPGEARLVAPGQPLPDTALEGAAVVLAAGDDFRQLDVAAQGRRLGVPVAYVIEYTLRTRLIINRLGAAGLVRKLRSAAWEILTERRRRRAFRAAAALQANGLPAAQLYRRDTTDVLTYFDTRLAREMVVDEGTLAAKMAAVCAGRPLRLAYTGRLERMKGADHLLPIARALAAAGVPFTLDIYGRGALETRIAAELAQEPALPVQLNAPIDFTTRLVPWLQSEVDLFIVPHVQGDPSCTYAETLGCGVPIVGYANEAWGMMSDGQGFGWAAALGDPVALARIIADLHADRGRIAAAMAAARAFGVAHHFEGVFDQRVEHLRGVARV